MESVAAAVVAFLAGGGGCCGSLRSHPPSKSGKIRLIRKSVLLNDFICFLQDLFNRLEGARVFRVCNPLPVFMFFRKGKGGNGREETIKKEIGSGPE